MNRQNISSGSPWENIVGYSRAVRIGNLIEVSGTVSSNEQGETIGIGSVYLQTKYILDKIEKSILEGGGCLNDIYKIRAFITDISRWEEFGNAHAEFFNTIKPCCTLVEVKGLIHKDFLIEIEASAMINA
jgi:enamine deaminase RidA (YjgF/YER057c/UK114 family)